MLLKLGSKVGLNGMVSAIVWSGSNFIDQYFTFLGHKHFNGQQTHHAQLFDNRLGDFQRFVADGRVYFSWGKEKFYQIGDWVKHAFHRRKSLHFPLFVSGHNDSYFFFEIHQFFKKTWSFKSQFHSGLIPYDLDASSIITL